MLAYLLGYKLLDFTNDRGEPVKGTQAFVAFQEDGVTGQRTEKLFFNESKGMVIPELTIGMTLDVAYNRRGKPEKVTAVETPQRLNLNKR